MLIQKTHFRQKEKDFRIGEHLRSYRFSFKNLKVRLFSSLICKHSRDTKSPPC
ncbi:hypothetical protein N665_0091s0031 [Sinapis alba]|nr:hypothetical protein N665_0091s0031 [Sinapis alba]